MRINSKRRDNHIESANLVTALGVVEIPPYEESYWGGNGNSSYLWITGWCLILGSYGKESWA